MQLPNTKYRLNAKKYCLNAKKVDKLDFLQKKVLYL